MSSSNLVQLVAIPETAYGKMPDLASALGHVIAFTSESLSGTPTTAASQTIRSDRQGAGQATVGLESGGEISMELAKQPAIDLFIEMALMSQWVDPDEALAVDGRVTYDLSDGDQLAKLTLSTETFPALFDRSVAPRDVLVIDGSPRIVARVIDDTTVELLVPRFTEEATTDGPFDLVLAGYVDVGQQQHSVRLGKAYLDVPTSEASDGDAVHGQEYAGSLVNSMALQFAYGSIVTAAFGFLANGYDQKSPALHQRLIAAGGDLQPPEPSIPLNASIDVPVVFTMDGLGVLNPTDFCIESVNLNLTNNLSPQTCIGKLAPNRYTLGQADVSFEATIYNATSSYERFMPAKLTQQPVGFGLLTGNADGGYGFLVAAAQLNFPDPSATGPNASVFINASGTAKAGADGLSSLRVFQW